jgi:hypothetical protein
VTAGAITSPASLETTLTGRHAGWWRGFLLGRCRCQCHACVCHVAYGNCGHAVVARLAPAGCSTTSFHWKYHPACVHHSHQCPMTAQQVALLVVLGPGTGTWLPASCPGLQQPMYEGLNACLGHSALPASCLLPATRAHATAAVQPHHPPGLHVLLIPLQLVPLSLERGQLLGQGPCAAPATLQLLVLGLQSSQLMRQPLNLGPAMLQLLVYSIHLYRQLLCALRCCLHGPWCIHRLVVLICLKIMVPKVARMAAQCFGGCIIASFAIVTERPCCLSAPGCRPVLVMNIPGSTLLKLAQVCGSIQSIPAIIPGLGMVLEVALVCLGALCT